MATLTLEIYGTLSPQSLQVTRNAISLLASAVGATPCVSQDGRTIDLFGQVAARANRLAAPESSALSKIPGTYGPTGTDLSAHDCLQQYLESKLRTSLRGSPWCEVTWQPWITPWGPCLSRPRARELASYATDFGLGPSLTAKGNLFAPSMQKWPLHRKLLPALTCRDSRSVKGAAPKPGRQGGKQGQQLLAEIEDSNTGGMNPAWAGWYMGYPPVWEELRPLETPSSRKLRRAS